MSSVGSTVIEDTRVRLAGFAEQVRTSLAALSDDELWQRPNPGCNAVGNLVLHLCGSTRHFLGRGVGGSDYVRDRPREFSEPGPLPRAQLLSILEATLREAEAVLAGVAPDRLLETTDRVGGSHSVLALLLRVTHHWAVHTGQIVYVAKAAHAGSIDELWMKTMQGR
jgi:uncharacterized damage-inducible protein DinB